jgi:hypothetical protein
MDFIDIGWREGLLLAVVVAAVYLVVALLGLARLKRRREFVADAGHPFVVSELPVSQPMSPAVGLENDRRHAPAIEMPVEPTASDRGESDFAHQLAWREIEVTVGQLRAEVASLRQELSELRNEQVQRRISPLYADAAALAGRGFDARGVAEECGISVAEAELVLAMSRDEKKFDNEDDHDGTRYAPAAEPAGR